MAARNEGPFAGTGRDVLIVDALRTPIGRSHPERGWVHDVHPNAMLGAVYTALLDGAGLAPEDIEDLIVGCTAPFGEQSRNIAATPGSRPATRPRSRPPCRARPGRGGGEQRRLRRLHAVRRDE